MSAAILRDRHGYDRILEMQSRPIMGALDYSESADGSVEVLTDSASLYRYPDLTAHAEYLYAKVEEAIDKDMHDEITYLQTYDRARDHLRAVRHLPDIVASILVSSGALICLPQLQVEPLSRQLGRGRPSRMSSPSPTRRSLKSLRTASAPRSVSVRRSRSRLSRRCTPPGP